MKYIALLRGVNVGGKTPVKMAALKDMFEKNGFTGVKTYINSGNIIFQAADADISKITLKLEEAVKKEFNNDIPVVVLSEKQLKQVINEAPADWNSRKDIRCYVFFVKEPAMVKDVAKELQPREGVDFVQVGHLAVYVTTLLSALMKSGVSKIVGKPIYKNITLRYFTTAKKLLKLTA